MRDITALVFGGRHLDPVKVTDWLTDRFHLYTARTLPGNLFAKVTIIDGVATGGDHGGYCFAQYMEHHTMQFPMRNDNDGPSRNSRMLLTGLPDIAFGFPGGRGTTDMLRKVERVNCPLVRVTGDFGFIRRPVRRSPDQESERNRVFL